MEKFGLFKLLSPFLQSDRQETDTEEQTHEKPRALTPPKYDKTRSYLSFMEQHSKHSAAAKKNK